MKFADADRDASELRLQATQHLPDPFFSLRQLRDGKISSS